jgi:hypothetical protein
MVMTGLLGLVQIVHNMVLVLLSLCAPTCVLPIVLILQYIRSAGHGILTVGMA